jgi:hypothetical protein
MQPDNCECEFESEVLAAVLQSRWPERVDASLRAHAAQCIVCSDAAAIAGSIETAREEMRSLASVPSAGRVWFLAQLKARREAARAAARPILVVQLIAAASACGLTGACFGASSLRAAGELASHSLIALAVCAAFLLLPAAAWLAVRKE